MRLDTPNLKKTTFYEEFFVNSKPKSPIYSGSSLTRVRGSKPDEARGPKFFLPRFCSLNFSKLWLFGFSNSIYWVFFGVSVTSPCSVFCLLGKKSVSRIFSFWTKRFQSQQRFLRVKKLSSTEIDTEGQKSTLQIRHVQNFWP